MLHSAVAKKQKKNQPKKKHFLSVYYHIHPHSPIFKAQAKKNLRETPMDVRNTEYKHVKQNNREI